MTWKRQANTRPILTEAGWSWHATIYFLWSFHPEFKAKVEPLDLWPSYLFNIPTPFAVAGPWVSWPVLHYTFITRNKRRQPLLMCEVQSLNTCTCMAFNREIKIGPIKIQVFTFRMFTYVNLHNLISKHEHMAPSFISGNESKKLSKVPCRWRPGQILLWTLYGSRTCFQKLSTRLQQYIPPTIDVRNETDTIQTIILLLLSNRALYWFTAVGSETVFYSNQCYRPDLYHIWLWTKNLAWTRLTLFK